MKLPKHERIITIAALCLFADNAFAHTGVHTGSGFAGGFAHPMLGLDHLLAMVAIGVWAAQQGGRALWAVPATFVTVMVLGGLVALTGWVLPHVETGISLSVLVLGLLIAFQRNWPVTAGMSIAAVFALFHGYAHGLEMPQTASPLLFAAGFVLATSLLHGVGIISGRIGRDWVRAVGLLIAATGFALTGFSLMPGV
jgi:urease accessory protein